MKTGMLYLLIIAFSVTSGAQAQGFYTCDVLTTLNCNSTLFVPIKECGTNGMTYNNRCEFGKQHCKDHSIHIQHSGSCDPGSTMSPPDATTVSPIPPMYNGTDALLDFFCVELSHMNCPLAQEPVCGSDGITYVNLCEYEKSRCTHRKLHVAYFGTCITR